MDLPFSVDGFELDRTAAKGYVLQCTKESVLRSVEEDESKGSEYWMDVLLSFVAVALEDTERNEIFVLKRSDGVRAGMLWMSRSKDQYTCDDTGYIMGIYVEKTFRGKGLGKALMKAAEEWCRINGLLSVTLNVSPLNPVISLYKGCGFKERSVVMRKDLRQ